MQSADGMTWRKPGHRVLLHRESLARLRVSVTSLDGTRDKPKLKREFCFPLIQGRTLQISIDFFSVTNVPVRDYSFLYVPVIMYNCSLIKLNIWNGVAPSEASDKGVCNGSSWLFYVPHVYHTHRHTRRFYPYCHTVVPFLLTVIHRCGYTFIPACGGSIK